jgi:hypothetical protein
MSEDKMDRMVDAVREHYNAPGEVPREQMWSAIAEGLEQNADGTTEQRGSDVIDLGAERQKRNWVTAHPVGWAVAASALLVMGVGIGRATAPTVQPATVVRETVSNEAGLRYAAAEHFGRTESLLTMVRADARRGEIDPVAGEWARGLLAQTRLLMDAEADDGTGMSDLLEDLELVLVQIVGVAEGQSMDEGRVRTELALTLSGLDDTELLSRLQAATPHFGMSGA